MYKWDDADDLLMPDNPTFTDDAGKVELLRLMVGRDSFTAFQESVNMFCCGGYFFLKDYILDTTGKLLKSAYEFLKEADK